MRAETVMRASGVPGFFASPSENNIPINQLFERSGLTEVARQPGQGAVLVYWRQNLDSE